MCVINSIKNHFSQKTVWLAVIKYRFSQFSMQRKIQPNFCSRKKFFNKPHANNNIYDFMKQKNNWAAHSCPATFQDIRPWQSFLSLLVRAKPLSNLVVLRLQRHTRAHLRELGHKLLCQGEECRAQTTIQREEIPCPPKSADRLWRARIRKDALCRILRSFGGSKFSLLGRLGECYGIRTHFTLILVWILLKFAQLCAKIFWTRKHAQIPNELSEKSGKKYAHYYCSKNPRRIYAEKQMINNVTNNKRNDDNNNNIL